MVKIWCLNARSKIPQKLPQIGRNIKEDRKKEEFVQKTMKFQPNLINHCIKDHQKTSQLHIPRLSLCARKRTAGQAKILKNGPKIATISGTNHKRKLLKNGQKWVG